VICCVAPVVEVRTKAEMLTVKDKIEGWAGRVSATMVMLTEPVSLPPPPPATPSGRGQATARGQYQDTQYESEKRKLVAVHHKPHAKVMCDAEPARETRSLC